jgi:hypothetical protein
MFSRNFIFSEYLAPGRPTDSVHPDAWVGCYAPPANTDAWVGCYAPPANTEMSFARVHPAQASIPRQRPASRCSTAACIVPCPCLVSHLAAALLNSTSRTSLNCCGKMERREGKGGEGEETARCAARGRSCSPATSR